MLPTPAQIREKLLKELDDNNEVHEPTVVEMASILEKYPFTRATLEGTKIGKMVNDLRRKVKNEKLAKRLKQLVRNWQNFANTPPVNGTPRQGIAKLQLSPAVSPSPTPTRGAPGVNCPAQLRGKPNTPTLSTYKSGSPALQSSKSGVTVDGKRIFPCPVPDQSVASPGLADSRRKTYLNPSASGHMVSPLVSGQVSSPALSGHGSSETALRTSAAGRNRMSDPALNKVRGQSVPQVASSPAQHLTNHGARLLNRHDSVRASSGFRFKGKDNCISDKSDLGGRTTPTSVHSENSQDRIIGETGSGRQDSDAESSCSSRTSQSRHTYPLSHSTDMLKNINTSNLVKDQRELSKANVASRKRARKNSTSQSETRKKSRIDSSSLLFTNHRPEKAVNGHKKSNKKSLLGVDIAHGSPYSSVWRDDKRISSPHLTNPLSDSHAIPPQSDMLLRHEYPDSSISAQTSGLPVQDKHKGKVKTTEQLIQDLQKNSSHVVGSRIMDKLRNNQIEKEIDVPVSALPDSIKPPGRRGRQGKNDVSVSVPSSDVMLSKNELVERFLKTSDPPASVEDYSIFRDDMLPSPGQLGPCSNASSKDSFDGNFSASREDHSESAPKDESSMDAAFPDLASTTQSEGTGSALALQEIYSQLPPVDDNIDWDSVGFYELPERIPATEESIDRLHNDHLPGINGMYDISGDWTTWQQALTLPSHEGNQLHILPYVDLDN